MMKVTIIVLDSLGIGELPDAEKFGDKGADTLGHITENYKIMDIPNMQKLGFGNVDGAANGEYIVENPIGGYGKLAEVSQGKDTITGHWEMAGIVTEIPFKTYPEGFPKKFMDKFEKAIGVKTIGNYPASGTEIIEDLGPEHEKTGKPIVYTSADSVLQIAAHTDVIPLKRLYEMCSIAREMLVGEFACGRVIARPYITENGKRVRTSDRHDYAVNPPKDTVLDDIKNSGKIVYGVGKISDIFNGTGISESVHTVSNMDGVDKTIEAMEMDFQGLIFTNLVDFDAKYGHRRDPEGYGKAIEEFDKRLPQIIEAMGDNDVLMLTADHGNDPTARGTDHTREYVPIVVYSKKMKESVNLGTRKSFADIGATVSDLLGIKLPENGESFKDLLAL
ncbi:MAG: phosphopentomutase [Clostridiales bacterium]|nr:phosphopentomutase [Clostridiales bacterium]